MPSPVSLEHKNLIERVRRLFPDKEVIGWPGPEMNLGQLACLSNCNLRADIFIWWNDEHTRAVVIEYQSEIHNLDKATEWHDPDEIKGRDDLKKQLVARLGAVIIEVDRGVLQSISDYELIEIITGAASQSWVENVQRKNGRWTYRTLNPKHKREWVKKDEVWKSRKFGSTGVKLPRKQFRRKSF